MKTHSPKAVIASWRRISVSGVVPVTRERVRRMMSRKQGTPGTDRIFACRGVVVPGELQMPKRPKFKFKALGAVWKEAKRSKLKV